MHFINNSKETCTVSKILVMPVPGITTYIFKQVTAHRIALHVTGSEKVTKNKTQRSKGLICIPLNIYFFSLWTRVGSEKMKSLVSYLGRMWDHYQTLTKTAGSSRNIFQRTLGDWFMTESVLWHFLLHHLLRRRLILSASVVMFNWNHQNVLLCVCFLFFLH